MTDLGLFQAVFYLFYHQLGCDARQTGIVAPQAGFVAIDGARAAGQVYLYGMVHALSPAQKTCIGMCGTPHTYHRRVYQ